MTDMGYYSNITQLPVHRTDTIYRVRDLSITSQLRDAYYHLINRLGFMP